eukprot:1499532-Rhodomonas_salina.3
MLGTIFSPARVESGGKGQRACESARRAAVVSSSTPRCSPSRMTRLPRVVPLSCHARPREGAGGRERGEALGSEESALEGGARANCAPPLVQPPEVFRPRHLPPAMVLQHRPVRARANGTPDVSCWRGCCCVSEEWAWVVSGKSVAMRRGSYSQRWKKGASAMSARLNSFSPKKKPESATGGAQSVSAKAVRTAGEQDIWHLTGSPSSCSPAASPRGAIHTRESAPVHPTPTTLL